MQCDLSPTLFVFNDTQHWGIEIPSRAHDKAEKISIVNSKKLTTISISVVRREKALKAFLFSVRDVHFKLTFTRRLKLAAAARS